MEQTIRGLSRRWERFKASLPTFGAGGGSTSRSKSPGRSLHIEPLEPRIVLSSHNLVDFVAQPSGALDGKIVFTSGGHGIEWTSSNGFYAGRNEFQSTEVNEAFGNQDQLFFFAEHLLRAGATVAAMRPIGHQLNEVVLDNDSAGVTYAGAWSNSSSSVFYDEDYGAAADVVSYRFASISATETATATYAPNIPEAGFYPVYTWVLDSGNRTNQLYRINDSAGGVTEVRVDHRLVGKGWVYLGTYHFDAGTSGSVEISNQSTEGGSVVIADAIRFGNGMGDLPDGPNGVGHPSGSTSGAPREDENSLLWTWRAIGQGNSAAAVIGASNISAPHRMAEHMNNNANPFGASVYIGFHSNATGNHNARGAVGLWNASPSERTPNQAALALFTGRQINQDMQALNGLFEHNWSTTTSHTTNFQNFGEIDGGPGAEMDMTIIEVAFHDQVQDADLLNDPKVRDQLARSTYEAAIEYFANFGGLADTTSLPSTPTGVRATTNASGDITVSWDPGPTGVQGGTPTAYRIYVSRDGYGYLGYDEVAGAGSGSHTFAAADLDDDPYYFNVVAVNSGGESPRSLVVAAKKPGLSDRRVLIVEGFDRNDRFLNESYPDPFSGDPDGLDLVDRVRPRYNNTFDYSIQVADAIAASTTGVGINATSNEALIAGDVTLDDYEAVIWTSGEESSADDTFNATEQSKVTTYLAGGGQLFVSGAEIAWELDNLNFGRAFYNNQLHADYVSDDANTYNVSGAAGSIFAGMSFSFDDGTLFYDSEFPDRINPLGGATTALNYVGGTGGGAAIQFDGGPGQAKVVNFGFPFETITDSADRSAVMGKVLEFFGIGLGPVSADFDIDGDIDGRDFLAWQRGFGHPSPNLADGDGNNDGAVDATDLGIWESQFGTIPIAPVAPVAAATVTGLSDVGTQSDGALSGKIVYVHAGHGITADNLGNGAWTFQRPLLLGMIEDLGNQDQMTFFADYLFRSGATVAALRPIGHQSNEVVLDNDDAEVSFVGTWSNSSSSIYFGDPGDVPYRFASKSATETAFARYRPDIAESGFYPVYSWTRYGSDRVDDQLYRINHSGGITEVTVNHRRVGNGTVYLGTYYFEAGTDGYVDISNRSSDSSGSVVIADMIRFGNGVGDIDRGGGISGRDREDEAGLYWVKWHVDHSQGIPDSEYRTSSSDRTATVSLSPRYAEYMNRSSDGVHSDRVFVSFHSNAAGGRGVLGLYNGNNNPSTATPNQFRLANMLGREVNDDLVDQVGQFEHDWFDRGPLSSDVTLDRTDIEFGEINNLRINNEFDATIVETGFHDNTQDAQMLRDPKVRDALARATYQGVVKYFNNVDGGATPVVMLPGKVDGVRAETVGSGSVTVSWNPPAANRYNGDTATGYLVYRSTNGYGFDGGTFVAGGTTTSHTFYSLDPEERVYYFKVAAVNSGGESPSSEVVAAIPNAGSKDILIVNGFDRLSRQQNPVQSGAERVRPRQSNSFDYAVQVASGIEAAAPALVVDTASNESIIAGDIDLGDYQAVVWILGEESSDDDTFDATEQTLVADYLAAGGKLFVSGAEIAWDLDFLNNGRAFYEGTLHGDYASDDAATYNVTGAAGSIFEGLSFSFDDGSQFYDVNFPDVIAAAAVGGEQILDNDDGPSVYTETGSWSTSTGTGFNGGTYRFSPADAAPATAEWEFFAPFAGQGEVFVQYVAGSNRADNAVYQINTGGGAEAASINQKINSLTWVSLGTFDFTQGTHQVVLDAGASTGGSVVIADAVRVVIAAPAAGTGDFDDDGDRDGRDFLAWQQGFGSANPTQADGDGNGDNVVDAADLGIWESQFGTNPVAASTVTALNYVGGTGGGAAIQFDSGASTKVVNFGFPLETITDAATRDTVIGRVLEFFDFQLAPIAGATASDAQSSQSAPALDDLAALAQHVALADQISAGNEVEPVLVDDHSSSVHPSPTSQSVTAGDRPVASAVSASTSTAKTEAGDDYEHAADEVFRESMLDDRAFSWRGL